MVDYARVSMELEKLRPPKLTGKRPARRKKHERHAQTKVAFFRYGYYDIAFKYFTERVLDAEFVPLPPATRRTLELGSQHSNDFVCAPFKHILGDYLEALELGADVLVQFTGPCRLGYYGEVQESILRDLGYDFRMLNFAVVGGKPATEYVKLCRRTVNPNVSLKQGVIEMMTTFRLIECLDAYHDAYLELAGFALDADEPKRLQSAFYRAMRAATSRAEVEAAYAAGLEALERMPQHTAADPVRVGIVGEYFTAVDAHSNLNVEEKLLGMGGQGGAHAQHHQPEPPLQREEPARVRRAVRALRHGPHVHAHRGRGEEVRRGRLRRHHPPEELRLHARDRLHARAPAREQGLRNPRALPELRLANERHRPRHAARGVL